MCPPPQGRTRGGEARASRGPAEVGYASPRHCNTVGLRDLPCIQPVLGQQGMEDAAARVAREARGAGTPGPLGEARQDTEGRQAFADGQGPRGRAGGSISPAPPASSQPPAPWPVSCSRHVPAWGLPALGRPPDPHRSQRPGVRGQQQPGRALNGPGWTPFGWDRVLEGLGWRPKEQGMSGA